MIINKKIPLAVASGVFVAVEITLGVLLQLSPGGYGYVFSYASVVLACVFFTLFAERSASYLFAQLALVFTLVSDYFLVVSDVRRQLPAMIFFSMAQLAYFARLYFEEERVAYRRWNVIVRVIASILAVSVTAVVLGAAADAVALVSMFYYANLLTNVAFAFIQIKRSAPLAVGLVLFAMCDALIGLAFIDGYISLSPNSIIYKIVYPGFDLAWAFYLPSQTLIALSLLPKRWRGATQK